MQVTIQNDVVKPNESMTVAVDISKAKLHLFSRVRADGRLAEVRDVAANSNRDIARALNEYSKKSQQLGWTGHLNVVCEPTGGYEQKLLATARRMGHTTEYVSGQAVNRCKTVESNDTGKSDQKDPGVIHTLAEQGRTLQTRELQDEYCTLRTLNEIRESEVTRMVEDKNRLQDAVKMLFVDWNIRPDFVYTATGRVLVEQFGCSPYRIVQAGWETFCKKMRKVGRGYRHATVVKIWNLAQTSVRHKLGSGTEDTMVERIRELYGDYQEHEKRVREVQDRMVEIYNKLPEAELLRTLPDRIKSTLLSQLIAETGPLNDFASAKQLLRYAGLNLRERTSGKFQGRIKISKKGRALLRKVLYQIAFGHLIPKGCLYADWYQRKKQDLDCSLKAIVAVMRHFLQCVHSVARSGERFSPERLFTQKQLLQRAA